MDGDKFRENETGASFSLVNPVLKVYERIPFCVMGLEFQVWPDGNSIMINSKLYSSSGYFLPSYLVLKYRDMPLTTGHADTIYNNNQSLIKFHLPINALNYIEDKRIDDISISIEIIGKYYLFLNSGNEKINRSGPAMFNLRIDYSQSKWIKLLSEAGYNDKWIVEIDRPKIEGFHEVIEHLEKAKDALYNKKEPEDVLRDLRAARDSFRYYYDKNKEKMFELIDMGSSGEEKYRKKSERIEDIYKALGEILNIGPHNNKYKVTYQDALLSYREFISILSYFSTILAEVAKTEGESK